MDRNPSRVLLITPHPDDAEGGCGGTVAKWIRHGAEVNYVLCTNGDKGASDPEMPPERLAAIREKEQLEAARVLGVTHVVFLRHPDGALEDDRQLRGEVVREIRRFQPDVVMCLDPVRMYSHSHRDHRVSGQVAVDAAFTYAWRPLYFPELGLQPHAVQEVYFWGGDRPNTFVDIGDTIELKVQTLVQHVSQFPDPNRRGQGVWEMAKRVGQRANLTYAEGFRVLRFSQDPLLVG